MFSQKGYEGTNIRELTASLGMVKSSMYRHFESKEAIWDTIMTVPESPMFNAPEADAVTGPRLELMRQAGTSYARTT